MKLELPIKRSWQTGEGISAYSLLAVGAYFLTYLMGDDARNILDKVDINAAMEHAKTSVEIAKNLQAEATAIAADKFESLGKTGFILVFMYKVFGRITTARTDLKKSISKEAIKNSNEVVVREPEV